MMGLNSIQRIEAAIHCSSDMDHVPVIPIMRFAAVKLKGYRLEETMHDWGKMMEAELFAWEQFGYDAREGLF